MLEPVQAPVQHGELLVDALQVPRRAGAGVLCRSGGQEADRVLERAHQLGDVALGHALQQHHIGVRGAAGLQGRRAQQRVDPQQQGLGAVQQALLRRPLDVAPHPMDASALLGGVLDDLLQHRPGAGGDLLRGAAQARRPRSTIAQQEGAAAARHRGDAEARQERGEQTGPAHQGAHAEEHEAADPEHAREHHRHADGQPAPAPAGQRDRAGARGVDRALEGCGAGGPRPGRGRRRGAQAGVPARTGARRRPAGTGRVPAGRGALGAHGNRGPLCGRS